MYLFCLVRQWMQTSCQWTCCWSCMHMHVLPSEKKIWMPCMQDPENIAADKCLIIDVPFSSWIKCVLMSHVKPYYCLGPGFSQSSPDVTHNFEDMEYMDSSGEKEYLSAFVVPKVRSKAFTISSCAWKHAGKRRQEQHAFSFIRILSWDSMLDESVAFSAMHCAFLCRGPSW